MDVEITVVPEKTEQVSPWVEAAILDVEFFRSWIKGEISDATTTPARIISPANPTVCSVSIRRYA